MKYTFVVGVMVIFIAGCGLGPAASLQENEQQTGKVLIVTGIDHPAHNWQQTAPALADVLRENKRLRVDVVEQPHFLGSEKIFDYDIIVIHFMNWEKPDPGPIARANLQNFVNNGKGLFVLHFGCGAFQGWDEFKNLAGRIWDPEMRAHDPHGPFKVDIINKNHPITRGIDSFQTDDELYTCLAGNKKVNMLATARSKVDDKDYPMAFIFNYGKGRVFHCALGHDVKAIKNPPAAELLRRGCAWAVGLSPVVINPN
ncbi:MAG: ThuA domain-containing protein [Sedimentisphaerales bacterium]|nr:ThuA domain-containing protein [Sedimentisphaerales bacterium]